MVPKGSKWVCLKIGYPLNRVTDIDWSSYPFSDTSILHCCLKHHMFVFISHNSQHVQYIPIHSNIFQYIPIYSNIFQYIPIYSNIIIPMYSLCTFHPFFNSRPATSSIHSGTAGPIRRRTSFRRDFLDAFDLEIRNHRWSLQGKCHEMSMFSSYLISVNK